VVVVEEEVVVEGVVEEEADGLERAIAGFTSVDRFSPGVGGGGGSAVVAFAPNSRKGEIRTGCLQGCDPKHSGTGKNVTTREACYWITRMAGLQPQQHRESQ
jgi:hypothetical protein